MDPRREIAHETMVQDTGQYRNQPPRTILYQLGPYRLESILGQGAVAVVYRAQRQNGQTVALKVLQPTAANQPHIRRRFLYEYRLTSRLRHPGIIRAMDAGEIDGYFYLALELVEGETLEDLLARTQTLGEEPTIAIAIQVAEALDYLHSHRIVHRDIKTSNIMLNHNRRAYIFDFGAALDLDAPLPDDLDGSLYGTPAFLAPEQAAGARVIDGRADLYALGVVLYRMVSGRKPFYGGRNEVLEAHISARPTKPSEFNYVSPGLEAIILRAMAKQPDDRFQTGAEFAQALRDVRLEPAPAPQDVGGRLRSWLRNVTG